MWLGKKKENIFYIYIGKRGFSLLHNNNIIILTSCIDEILSA